MNRPAVLWFSVLLLAASVAARRRTDGGLHGGMALALGENTRPGFNIGAEAVVRPIRFFGIGGTLEYAWISQTPPALHSSAARHYIQLSVLPRLYFPGSGRAGIYVDIDPGFCFLLSTSRSPNGVSSGGEPSAALTFGAGLMFRRLAFGVRYKPVARAQNLLVLHAGFVF